MASKHSVVLSIVVVFIICTVGWTASANQEDTYHLANEDVFGKLRRPSVIFPHNIHDDTLADEDCVICHHEQDEDTGKLIYEEGEEQGCAECHGTHKEGSSPALREAFHGSCTVCHRNIIKNNNLKAGPTTCGGCHQKK